MLEIFKGGPLLSPLLLFSPLSTYVHAKSRSQQKAVEEEMLVNKISFQRDASVGSSIE